MAKLSLSPEVIIKLKDHILGASYDLSLAFISSRESRALNRRYRGHDKPTNILSFPLDGQSGEIVLDRTLVSKEAKMRGQNFSDYCTYLLIHGLLHLKGLTHGSRMEQQERQLAKIFLDTHGQNYRRRIRHRNRHR